MKKIISQGAEAILSTDGKTVTKDRVTKSYRHPALDGRLRKTRTRHEAKILGMLMQSRFPAPQVTSVDEEKMVLQIEHIPGALIKQVLDSNEKDSSVCLRICKEIGEKVAWLHSLEVIHHDLTTSNMILHEKKKEVFFIDFGLSFISKKIEDKAVDLHLLLHALQSKHYRIADACFAEVLAGYSEKSKQAEAVIERLHLVEKRGRYKQGS
ncbi:Kae1-associated serine/threonine protein kinase [Candidatus Woesearchaeota archaeon]|nr:Kae1-associated serine/threonine protein kinase [Candidatus Woesearchaeota archaeon]